MIRVVGAPHRVGVHWRIKLTMPTFIRVLKPSIPGSSEPVISIKPLRAATRITSDSISSWCRISISFLRYASAAINP